MPDYKFQRPLKFKQSLKQKKKINSLNYDYFRLFRLFLFKLFLGKT